MTVINLDKFTSKKTVKIPDAGEYEVRLFTVGDFIDDKASSLLPENANVQNPKESAEALINFICSYSDIPREVIVRQNINMLRALAVIIQGGEVDGTENKEKNA